jgi:hypothetical protein
MGWSASFEDPIILPNGRKVRDAGNYIASLPKAVQNRPEWQAAAEALLLVVTRPHELDAVRPIRLHLSRGRTVRRLVRYSGERTADRDQQIAPVLRALINLMKRT